MNFKQSLKAAYQVITVVVAVVEAVEIGKNLYGKVKNRKAAVATDPVIIEEPAADTLAEGAI